MTRTCNTCSRCSASELLKLLIFDRWSCWPPDYRLRIFNGFTRVQCQCWYWWFDCVMQRCAHANIPYLTRLALLHIFRVTVKYWNPFDNEIIADFSIDRLGSKKWPCQPCPILAASLVRVISMAVGCQSRPLVHGDVASRELGFGVPTWQELNVKAIAGDHFGMNCVGVLCANMGKRSTLFCHLYIYNLYTSFILFFYWWTHFAMLFWVGYVLFCSNFVSWNLGVTFMW